MTTAGVLSEAVVRAAAVSRHYRRGAERVTALEHVDLTLRRGEVVALVGPSGSGKTTLLNLLCGWERPDDGELHWRDGSPDLDQRPWADIAIVPQALGLLEDLTISENVLLPARLSGVPETAEQQDRFEELMDSLAIGEFRTRRPRDTSLGEQQRAAIARALLLGPALVLADEPTAHQDATNATRILDRLVAAADAGGCALIATHSAEVQAAAQRVVRIVDGRIVDGRVS
jgi:putative ABC transport system ATP-binding protein